MYHHAGRIGRWKDGELSDGYKVFIKNFRQVRSTTASTQLKLDIELPKLAELLLINSQT